MDREQNMNLNETTTSQRGGEPGRVRHGDHAAGGADPQRAGRRRGLDRRIGKEDHLCRGRARAQSVFAADAGGEAAINFIRMSDDSAGHPGFRHQHGPEPGQHDPGGLRRPTTTTRASSQKRPKPGWGMEYLDYDYRIASHGTASRLGQSGVELVVSRLYQGRLLSLSGG